MAHININDDSFQIMTAYTDADNEWDQKLIQIFFAIENDIAINYCQT